MGLEKKAVESELEMAKDELLFRQRELSKSQCLLGDATAQVSELKKQLKQSNRQAKELLRGRDLELSRLDRRIEDLESRLAHSSTEGAKLNSELVNVLKELQFKDSEIVIFKSRLQEAGERIGSQEVEARDRERCLAEAQEKVKQVQFDCLMAE